MLTEWARKHEDELNGFELADKLPAKLYNEIDDINPCEIFHANVNHFLEEYRDKKGQN